MECTPQPKPTLKDARKRQVILSFDESGDLSGYRIFCTSFEDEALVEAPLKWVIGVYRIRSYLLNSLLKLREVA